VLKSNFLAIVLRARSARNTITLHDYPNKNYYFDFAQLAYTER